MVARVAAAALLLIGLYLAGCRKDETPVSEDDGLPPAVPADPLITYATDGAVILEWRRNSEPDFAAYRVFRSTDSVQFTLLDTVYRNYFIDDTLRYDINYYYQVTAFDFSGKESARSVVCGATPLNRYPPSRPYSLSANGVNREGARSISVSWNASGSNDVAGYLIYRGANEGFAADSTALRAFTTGTYWADTTGITPLLAYYYKVRTADRGGLQSSPTTAVSAVVYPVAAQLSPANNSTIERFANFTILGIGTACRYRVVLLANPEYGDLWYGETVGTALDDTLAIRFTYYPLQGVPYYWRVITYADDAEQPRSISPVYRFTVR